jgi:hypothetical protein
MSSKILDPKDNEGNPDNAKADELRMVEWLFIQEYTDQKLHGRRDILKQTYHSKRDLSGGGGKHQERNRGYNTRPNQ